MLPTLRVLRKKSEFSRVKKFGKRYDSDNITLLVYKRGDDSLTKFGFIISTDIDKRAVHRNRIRRAMNESVRQNMLFIPNGMDMLFIAKKTIIKRTVEEIMKEMKSLLLDTPF